MSGIDRRVAGLAAARTGAWGEALAARHLQAKGYRILERNWRSPVDRRDELDLICQDRELTVFVEVKTRRAGTLVRGLLALNGRKQAVLRRSIRAYLDAQARRSRYYRFDLVEIEYGPACTLSPGSILHVENFPLLRTRLF